MISPASSSAAAFLQLVSAPNQLNQASPNAGEAAGAEQTGESAGQRAEQPEEGAATPSTDRQAEGPDGLTAEERAIIAELAQTDREVRAHEQAHLAAAGGLARGVSFSYTTGPDGKQYAVGGEVSIDTSPVSGDPQATIQKAQQVRAAASAPANPSGQDRAVAAAAAGMEAAARQELAAEQQEQLEKLQGDNRSSRASEFEPKDDVSSSIGTIVSLIA